MIKNLLTTIVLVSASLIANAQSFTATYSFAATTSVSGTTDPSIPPTATGVTFGSFMAVGTSTNPTAAGRFSFTNWPTGATTGVDTYSAMTGSLSPTQYYEVTLTPASGYNLTLTNITFGVRRSGTGIRSYALRSNASAYASNLPASVVSNTNISVVGTNEFFWNFDAASTSTDQLGSMITLSGANYTGVTGPLTFRFYAWNAEGSTGTFSIDNVTFMGSTSVITGLGNLSYDLNSGLNIYPVPSTDGVLFIESKNQDIHKIEVLDVLGNTVLTNTSSADARLKLNMADMPAGNYFVRVYSENSVSTRKIVIVK